VKYALAFAALLVACHHDEAPKPVETAQVAAETDSKQMALAPTHENAAVDHQIAAAQSAAIGLARRLRDAGFVVELPAVEMKFGKSLGLADRMRARHAVIVGDDELSAGVVTVKRLSDGSQQKLGEQELFSYLRAVQSAGD